MKNLLVLLTLFTFASLSLNAQDETAAENVNAITVSVAEKAADMDASVEKRVCAKSGKVSFVKKNVCSASGKVSYNDVEFCSKSNAFVNVSPSTGKAASCTKGKAACTKKASGSAMKVSSVEGEASPKKAACSKSAKAGKACCAGKKAKGASASAAQPAKAVKVSNH